VKTGHSAARLRVLCFAGAVTIVALRPAAAQDSLHFVGPDAETSRQVSQIIESAAAAGLPASHILSKARFAVLVRAPGPKIVETAKAVSARLEMARQAIAPHALAIDITNAEEALSYNVPPEILRRVSQASPRQTIAVPLSILTQLVANGVPTEKAGKIVTELVQRGATAAQMVALGNDVEGDVRVGRRASSSVDVRLNALTRHLAPLPASAATEPAFTSGSPRKP